MELNAQNTRSIGSAENYQISQNYPNPFNQEIVIEFLLKEPAQVSLEIYDIKGHLVQTLVQQIWTAGTHRIIWNGKNNEGKNAGSGVYFCRFQARSNKGEFNRTIKMMLLK